MDRAVWISGQGPGRPCPADESCDGYGPPSGHLDQEIAILDLDGIGEGTEAGVQAALPGLEMEIVPVPRADDGVAIHLSLVERPRFVRADGIHGAIGSIHVEERDVPPVHLNQLSLTGGKLTPIREQS